MSFDDQWFDAKVGLVDAVDNIAGWLPEREKDAYRDAALVVEYLSYYVDFLIGQQPRPAPREDNPIPIAFPGLAERIKAAADHLRASGAAEMIARRKATL